MSSSNPLQNIKVTEVLDASFKLATVSSTAQVGEALALFKKTGVYSLPVLDEAGTPLGLLDLGDLIFHLVSCFFKATGVSTYEQLWTIPTTEFDGPKIAAEFSGAQVAPLMNVSGANPWAPLPSDSTTIHDAILALTKSRRLPLLGADGKLTAIVSQTNIIRYLAKHKDLIPEAIVHQSITDLNAVTRPLIRVPDSMRAIDAFALLAVKQFSAVGITASSGEPETIATLSVKDLSLLAQDFAYVIAPVEDFIKIIRQQDLHTIYPTIGCPASAQLVDVIVKMGATKLHRLLVHPIGSTEDYDGVISLGNVLKVISAHL